MEGTVFSQKQTTRKNKDYSKLINPKIMEKYANAKDIPAAPHATTTWEDNNMKGYEKLMMFDITELAEKAQDDLMKSTMDCLFKAVSCQSAGGLVIMAWQLISPHSGKKLFEGDEIATKDKDKKLEDLSNEVLVDTTVDIDYQLPEDRKKKMKVVSFIAASALRMITKTSTNYSNAFEHIKASYEKIYREDIRLTRVKPNQNCLDKLKKLLQGRRVLRNSIGSFLWKYDKLEGSDRGMCRQLFEQHVAFAGMHAYPLFLLAVSRLQMGTRELMLMLDHPMTTRALIVIQIILEQYELPDDKEQKKKNSKGTWKYARLYDENVFAELQTKNCTLLVAILAHLHSLLGTTGVGDILSITHIQKMDLENENFKVAVQNIYEYATRTRRIGKGKREEKTT